MICSFSSQDSSWMLFIWLTSSQPLNLSLSVILLGRPQVPFVNFSVIVQFFTYSLFLFLHIRREVLRIKWRARQIGSYPHGASFLRGTQIKVNDKVITRCYKCFKIKYWYRTYQRVTNGRSLYTYKCKHFFLFPNLIYSPQSTDL